MSDVVNRYLRDRDADASVRLVAAARRGELDDRQVARLAVGLAGSGFQLPREAVNADVASTGGPTSLSTLLCPLFLRARGLRVPKLGVPGRPAGGVDVLQTIPGFNATIDLAAARSVLARTGYVHLLADERWAPLDRELFSFRQRVRAQAVPELVIASILAKKLAAGVVGAGLEIRIAPHGNFGTDRSTARLNALRYKSVAELIDVKAVALLTDGSSPYQPYVGRGEALVALEEVLAGQADGWLADHAALCAAMAGAVADASGAGTGAQIRADVLRRAHEELLAGHGADISRFKERVEAVRSEPRITVSAPSSGWVEYDLRRLRDLLVRRQRDEAERGGVTVPDPAGVILGARPGLWVERDEPLMLVRVPKGEKALAAELGRCAAVSEAESSGGGRDNGFEVV